MHRYEAVWYFEKNQVVIMREEELGLPRPLTVLHRKTEIDNLGDATTWIESLDYHLASDWTLSSGGVPCRYVPLRKD